MIPSGYNAIVVDKNTGATDRFRATTQESEIVLTICTGRLLLEMTGKLDGCKVTTNKQHFLEAVHFGPDADWVRKASGVQDSKFFTSSGVSAGMDMALAVAEHLFGHETAESTAEGSEYEWHQDADRAHSRQAPGWSAVD